MPAENKKPKYTSADNINDHLVQYAFLHVANFCLDLKGGLIFPFYSLREWGRLICNSRYEEQQNIDYDRLQILLCSREYFILQEKVRELGHLKLEYFRHISFYGLYIYIYIVHIIKCIYIMLYARCLQTFTQLHLLLRLDNNFSGMFYNVANVNHKEQQLTIKHIKLRLSLSFYTRDF